MNEKNKLHKLNLNTDGIEAGLRCTGKPCHTQKRRKCISESIISTGLLCENVQIKCPSRGTPSSTRPILLRKYLSPPTHEGSNAPKGRNPIPLRSPERQIACDIHTPGAEHGRPLIPICILLVHIKNQPRSYHRKQVGGKRRKKKVTYDPPLQTRSLHSGDKLLSESSISRSTIIPPLAWGT